ncbi:MAG: amino-acid N-acetyltransferase [Verrucomicrobiales bacterium]|jgi:amino-acid N-acetyltransferase|nr:amino-acid N-acetyltransferase [Verrucomicrobiales bacterium]
MQFDRYRVDFASEFMNFSDLRAILQYVPQFRGATFVVALDGAVIDSPDFSHILLDLAVLRSLNIKVVLVHGAAAQIKALGEKRGISLSNIDGTGVTDETTLEVSMDAISRLSNSIMQSLTTVKLQAASANAIHAHPSGILKGVDTEFTGTIERIDASVLQSFLDQDILPVVPPLGFDADGQTLRVNSDMVAREVATALGASKILFLSIDDPRDSLPAGVRYWSEGSVGEFLQDHPDLAPGIASKLKHASAATRDGVTRVHLVGSQNDDALLSELFSNEGVGVMVYSDAYQRVRPATRSDADELHLLIHRAVEDEQLLERPRSEIVAAIEDYIVLEVDENIVGCVAVHPYPEAGKAELACLFVKKGHTGQGYGTTLVDAALQRSKELEAREVFALSTQAAGYLERAGFKRIDDLSVLPADRREKWEKNGRNAVVLSQRASS